MISFLMVSTPPRLDQVNVLNHAALGTLSLIVLREN